MTEQKRPPNFFVCQLCGGGKLIHVHNDEEMADEALIITFCPICDLSCRQCYDYSSRKYNK